MLKKAFLGAISLAFIIMLQDNNSYSEHTHQINSKKTANRQLL